MKTYLLHKISKLLIAYKTQSINPQEEVSYYDIEQLNQKIAQIDKKLESNYTKGQVIQIVNEVLKEQRQELEGKFEENLEKQKEEMESKFEANMKKQKKEMQEELEEKLKKKKEELEEENEEKIRKIVNLL